MVAINSIGANPVTVANGGSGIATQTAHAVYVGNGTSAPTALAVGATGTVLAGATGADPGWTGSPSVSGSLTAATTITATLGNITATNGNVVMSTAGNGVSIKEGSNARMGTATLVNGTVTVSNTSVTANTRIFVSRYAVNASAALGILTVGTVSASTSFVIYAATQGTPGTPLATDVSTVHWLLIEPAA